jgi:transcription-repair coupling factor (superfamily II helicase)
MISVTDFLNRYKNKDKKHLVSYKEGLNVSYFVSKIYQKSSEAKRILLLVPDEKELDNIYEELNFFQNNDVYKISSVDIPVYSELYPSPEVLGERNANIFRMLNNEKGIFLSTPISLMIPVIPKEVMKKNYIYLISGEHYIFEELKNNLPLLGYQRVDHVEVIGDYNIKGGIIDLFTPYYSYPLRIEFFGDQIESIRLFDVVTQRSIKDLEEAYIIPVRTVVSDFDKEIIHARIKDYADRNGINKKLRDEFFERFIVQSNYGGECFYANLIYGRKCSIIEYLNDFEIILLEREVAIKNTKDFIENAKKVYESKKDEAFVLKPEDIFDWESFDYFIKNASLLISSVSGEDEVVLDFEDNFHLKNRFELGLPKEKRHPIEKFLNFISDAKDIFKILVVANTPLQAKRIAEVISHFYVSTPEIVPNFSEFLQRAVKGKIYVTTGYLKNGFKNYSDGIWLFTEEEIFGKSERVRGERDSKKELKTVISDLYELNPGDLVVHVDHGVGIYRGLKQVEVLGNKGEYIEIEYADNDKLFVPVEKIGYIQKYITSEDYIAKIDKLGDKRWHKTKRKVKEDLKNWAEEIIRVEALRKSQEGYAFKIDPIALEEFSASFEFEETEDQLKAIEETLKDMEQNKPMDRLICGDVGFGKTEVALRAAFVAVNSKKQVCLIAPTTILAEQHYHVFKRRLEPFGFSVGLVSRFVEKAEQKKVLERLKNGDLDVIIGTHRLLSRDVVFKDLGLLIIDEEHKFGVVHKEKIKSLKSTVDILTLTATPIPRTLYMSVSGLKDISIIVSPPKGRQSIKTYISPFSESIIKDAVEREIQRGGQVFFIHNRVRSIGAMKKYLEKVLPGISIMVAHGQMDEEDLKKVIELFNAGKANLLLSTAIVESGLDLPNVNTIIVNRSDKFGLADLYQLRGRVGRSNRKAYAYFLIPSYELITKEAMKRLKILQELEELGSGFRLAIHDLEIRGAGDLLGKKQAGHINEIGLELYMQLLEEAVREIRFERGEVSSIKKEVSTEIKLNQPAYIPESYMPSSRERLDFYKKILGVKDVEGLRLVREDLEDRFGKIPVEVDNFLYQKELEIELSSIGCISCYINEDRLIIAFDNEYIPPKDVINKVLKDIKGAKFAIPDKFYFFLSNKGKDYGEVKKILQAFLERVKINR